ncbi:MAG TPA: hypothetical protein PLV32_05320, partial [Chitinophagaceae bacterium]|nr:hypothetical protein [Chitinophagaceae bacterium]
MLEDFAPAIRSDRKVKMVSASRSQSQEESGLESQISFRPFVNFLRNKSNDETDTRSRIYKYLIDRFEAVPALMEPISEQKVLDENRDLLELLGTTLFPVVSESKQNIFTFSVPYKFSIFHESGSFRDLFVRDDQFLLPGNASEEQLRQTQFALIYGHVM